MVTHFRRSRHREVPVLEASVSAEGVEDREDVEETEEEEATAERSPTRASEEARLC